MSEYYFSCKIVGIALSYLQSVMITVVISCTFISTRHSNARDLRISGKIPICNRLNQPPQIFFFIIVQLITSTNLSKFYYLFKFIIIRDSIEWHFPSEECGISTQVCQMVSNINGHTIRKKRETIQRNVVAKIFRTIYNVIKHIQMYARVI